MVHRLVRKTTALVAAISLAAVMFTPLTVSAQNNGNGNARPVALPVVGTVVGGGTFNGTATVTRFVNNNGTLTAVGFITGILTNASGTPTTVISTFATPVTIAQAT